MKKLLRFVLSAAVIASVSPDAVGQYISSGPYGGTVYTLYRDNVRLYAAGSGGVFTSANNGKGWTQLGSDPAVFGCDQIYSVAGSGAKVYAGSKQSGVYNSQNGGVTWTNSMAGLRVDPGAPYTDIEIVGPNVVTIRSDSGFLYLSVNNGNTWSRINGQINNSFAQHLSVYNNDLYVSTLQGLFVSNNGGTIYNLINSNPADIGELVWSGDTAYVATGDGIRMSTDFGMSFAPFALQGRAIRNLSVMGKNVYAVVRNPAPIQDSVLYSTNGGNSFSAAPIDPNTFRFTAVHDLAATAAGAVVGTDYGLYGSTNGGSSWGLSDSGYHATQVNGLAVSGGYVLAGTSPMGVFRVKPDSGSLMWQHTGTLAQNVERNIRTMASRGAIVHAGGPNGYYRSIDSGATWSATTPGVTGGNVSSIYASPTTPDVWLIRNGDLYYSLNDGAAFGAVVNSNIPTGTADFVTKADSLVFVAASSTATLYKGGTSMVFTPTNGTSGIITSVVHRDTMYYASTSGNGLFSSKDGMNWAPLSVAPGNLSGDINTLIVSDSGLLAGTNNGVYSNASGLWAQLALPGHAVKSLVERNDKLFIGTCSGVYSIPYKIETPPNRVKHLAGNATGLDIWPNPTKGDFKLRVRSAQAANAEVQLVDIRGSVVFRSQHTLKSGSNELHIPAQQRNLAPGIYTIQVVGEALRAAGRILIQ